MHLSPSSSSLLTHNTVLLPSLPFFTQHLTPILIFAMNLAGIITAKIFKSKKKSSRSVSRSESLPHSFSSNTSSSSSDDDGSRKRGGRSTPTSVIQAVGWPESANGDGVHFDLRHVFEMIDRDGDGKILKEELGELIRRLGAEPPSAEEMEVMLSEVDTDGDGCISLEEFRSMSEAFAPPTCDGELRCTFDFFDANGDGRITAEELFKVFRKIDARCTLKDCRRMIRGVDRNGEGFVCFEDFSRMMELQQL